MNAQSNKNSKQSLFNQSKLDFMKHALNQVSSFTENVAIVKGLLEANSSEVRIENETVLSEVINLLALIGTNLTAPNSSFEYFVNVLKTDLLKLLHYQGKIKDIRVKKLLIKLIFYFDVAILQINKQSVTVFKNMILGCGGTSSTYLTEFLVESKKKQLAIKFIWMNTNEISKTKEREDWFEREIKIMKLLHNNHVLQYINHERLIFHAYVVTPLCRYGNLNHLFDSIKGLILYTENNYKLPRLILKQDKFLMAKISNLTFYFFFEQMLRATAFVHQRRVVHRDIKPSNYIIKENYTVVISDFQLSIRIRKTQVPNEIINISRSGTLLYQSVDSLINSIEASQVFKLDYFQLGLSAFHLYFNISDIREESNDSSCKISTGVTKRDSYLKKADLEADLNEVHNYLMSNKYKKIYKDEIIDFIIKTTQIDVNQRTDSLSQLPLYDIMNKHPIKGMINHLRNTHSEIAINIKANDPKISSRNNRKLVIETQKIGHFFEDYYK